MSEGNFRSVQRGHSFQYIRQSHSISHHRACHSHSGSLLQLCCPASVSEFSSTPEDCKRDEV